MTRPARGAFKNKGSLYKPFQGVIAKRNSSGASRLVVDNYGADWREICKRVIERDQNVCVLCGNKRDRILYKLEVHHILPLSKGGRTAMNNLMSLCSDIHHPSRHAHLRKLK